MRTEIEQDEPGTNIKIIGIGSDGQCFIETLIESDLSGPEFIVADTDVACLAESNAAIKIQLEKPRFGTFVDPDSARCAAKQSEGAIEATLADAHMLIIECAIGEEITSGAASVIAQIARTMGILTLALVRVPFSCIFRQQQRIAKAGIADLAEHVDLLIPISPESLLDEEWLETDVDLLLTKFDGLVTSVVTGLSSLLLRVSLVCVDFEDVRTVMGGMGFGAVGFGGATGEGRAKRAAELAVNAASLGPKVLGAARGCLVQIWSSDKAPNRVRMKEVNDVINSVKAHLASDTHLIFGTVYADLGGALRVVIIACGTEQSPAHPNLPEEFEKGATAVKALQKQDFDHYEVPTFLRDNT